MKKSNNVISSVHTNSIAEELGIEVGDILISINDHEVEDIIEYKYLLTEEYLDVEIKKSDGETWIYEIEKDYDEDLGIEFENPILSHMKSCTNKCIFCFIDQLPPNMRKSMYFKDDDSRMSFLHGNYITLTNMSEDDINKIIKYRISPINVSVHTTDSELRKKMLNNKFAGDILSKLKKFAENQIAINCQIVLCRGVNDSQELDKTIEDLMKLSYAIRSVAVVPAGLTKYRDGLHSLIAYDAVSAKEVIKKVEKWQKEFQVKLKRSFIYIADEFYILADHAFPSYKSYDSFPQLENGIGMMVNFQQEFYQCLNKLTVRLMQQKKVTIITGELSYGYILEMCGDLEKKVGNLEINLVRVKNEFFGGHVSVSGLVTGTDIFRAVENIEVGDKIIIPKNMLKSDEDIFLDDFKVVDLEALKEKPVVISEVDGKKFILSIIEN
ncbi:MAG: radical SAM protein [Alkaliphilus sp.]|nr:MAG: radical SAM protein [Alkaliphilus sp.]